MKGSNIVRVVLSIAVIGILALGLTSTPAIAAGSQQIPLAVSATVLSNCSISTTAMGFGSYTGAVNNATSAFTITCSSGSSYTVGLDAGLTTGASVTTRQMGISQPAGGLNYALYSNSGMTTNWGNTSGSWVSGLGTGSAQTITVYGQISANQFVPIGSYVDTVTATITY